MAVDLALDLILEHPAGRRLSGPSIAPDRQHATSGPIGSSSGLQAGHCAGLPCVARHLVIELDQSCSTPPLKLLLDGCRSSIILPRKSEKLFPKPLISDHFHSVPEVLGLSAVFARHRLSIIRHELPPVPLP